MLNSCGTMNARSCWNRMASPGFSSDGGEDLSLNVFLLKMKPYRAYFISQKDGSVLEDLQR